MAVQIRQEFLVLPFSGLDGRQHADTLLTPSSPHGTTTRPPGSLCLPSCPGAHGSRDYCFCNFLLSPESRCPGRLDPPNLFYLTFYVFKVSVQIQVLCVPALHHLPHLFHDELQASYFFLKSFNVFPEYSVQLPFYFVTSILGLVEIALHLFNQASCFILLFPSLLELLQQIPDHSSFFSFLFFVRFNHLAHVRFSFRTFPTAFVPRICLFFHTGFHCVNLRRDLFPLALRLRIFPRIVQALAVFTGWVLPSGFCLSIPLFVLPSFPLLGHGKVFNRSRLFHCRQSHPLGESGTRTRWTRGEWSLSPKSAATSSIPSHSSECSSTSSPRQGKSTSLPPISHPPNSLFMSR